MIGCFGVASQLGGPGAVLQKRVRGPKKKKMGLETTDLGVGGGVFGGTTEGI
jgi:hypothetical protein